jgi:hypothetical protein
LNSSTQFLPGRPGHGFNGTRYGQFWFGLYQLILGRSISDSGIIPRPNSFSFQQASITC